ncbi:hypothetical protein BT67DRAFT_32897 [Trichocladium antarcticum]|uniref:Uncharacterized protein n=1 Tax=Trichocladium antarcticum TaxID=1450529 RepID=A0AAN6UJG1_9PEZI|nr:hypothetical protein BT67DRAFT_32897 [Trichocladium antarcticum]
MSNTNHVFDTHSPTGLGIIPSVESGSRGYTTNGGTSTLQRSFWQLPRAVIMQHEPPGICRAKQYEKTTRHSPQPALTRDCVGAAVSFAGREGFPDCRAQTREDLSRADWLVVCGGLSIQGGIELAAQPQAERRPIIACGEEHPRSQAGLGWCPVSQTIGLPADLTRPGEGSGRARSAGVAYDYVYPCRANLGAFLGERSPPVPSPGPAPPPPGTPARHQEQALRSTGWSNITNFLCAWESAMQYGYAAPVSRRILAPMLLSCACYPCQHASRNHFPHFHKPCAGSDTRRGLARTAEALKR